MICDYPDTGILKVSFWSFLSNTKNGANFNLPTPYGRTTIHEKLSASGRREWGEPTPWQGLCPWITLGSPPLSPSYKIYLWLNDTIMWVPICLYCSNCTKFGQLIFRKINCCHQMSDFKTKMHQIRFRLGLRPRPRWGSLQRSPRPPSWISGALLLRGGEGEVREGEEGKREGA